MKDAYFEFQAGRLICSAVREILESEQFHGRKIRWREGKGFISRTFSIAGDPQDVKRIIDRLEYYKWVIDAL